MKLPSTVNPNRAERMARAEDARAGRWYWVQEEDEEWLGCVTHEGSNFVKIEGPEDYSARVHLDDVDRLLREEHDPAGAISAIIKSHQDQAAALMAKVESRLRAIGVDPHPQLARGTTSASTALTAPHGRDEIKRYKQVLIKAQEKELPEMLAAIGEHHKKAAAWMQAQLLPLYAQLKQTSEAVGGIKNKIYAIELYAGLTEEVVRCCDGLPASSDERVHLMQRRLYMDEECLANYTAGGMDFADVGEFDRWLCQPENMNRILPFQKCIVSMQVRRHDKERDAPSLLEAFINIKLAELDRATFLYIRNGGAVYRLATDIDFGEKLFPDRSTFDPQRPMVAKMFGGRIDELIDGAAYDDMVRADKERERKYNKWMREHPAKKWDEEKHGPREWSNPHRDGNRDLHFYNYELFNPSSVYYDDISGLVAEKIMQYNRVALIVQGLLDRSQVFDPKPPVKTWRPDDFLSYVRLVYDASDALHSGEKPDFEAYRREVNAHLGAGSVTVGQQDYWERKEATKENERMARSAFRRRFVPLKRYAPYGNPGPGRAARVARWSASKQAATFEWGRQRSYRNIYGDGEGPLTTRVTVPASHLFNVSAYTPGDYKKFFVDSRTRAEYLEWAPLLLAAEDWYATNKRSTPRAISRRTRKKQ